MSETVRSITLKPGLKVNGTWASPDEFIPGQTDAITRDTLCDLGLLQSPVPQLEWPVQLSIIEGGDHSFNVPKSMHRSQASVNDEMTLAMSGWIQRLQGSSHVSEP